jgi:CRISPR-associated exonuclease Cas4
VRPGGSEVPFPIEYKRGRASRRQADRVQLCAQAMALEEMTRGAVPSGALFYHASRRRVPVEFTRDLRKETEACAVRLHEMFRWGAVPRASLESKCRQCSLQEACQPAPSGSADAAVYLQAIVDADGGQGSA